MTDISAFGFANDVEFAAHLVKEVGIACVPGSSFYKHPKDGSQQVRFAFCKKPETLDEAARRLEKLTARFAKYTQQLPVASLSVGPPSHCLKMRTGSLNLRFVPPEITRTLGHALIHSKLRYTSRSTPKYSPKVSAPCL